MSLLRRLWNVARRSRLDAELQQEIQTHLALIEDEKRTQGASTEEARREARARFGNPHSYREQALDEVVTMWLERLLKEVALAGRRLLGAPAFTLATVLTLGLAAGGAFAIVAVVYRVVLNPLPYGESERLVTLEVGFPDRHIPSGVNLTAALYYQYLDHAHTLEGVAAYRTGERTVTSDGLPERVRVCRTTASLPTVLGVNPERGRWFSAEEGMPGGPPVAVLSHGAWIRRYGGDSRVLGHQVTLDGTPTTIVGIMPPSFGFPDPVIELWIPDPMSRATASSPESRGVYDLSAIARRRPGTTIPDVSAELTRLAADLESDDPGQGYDKLVAAPTTLIDAMVGHVARTLWVLLVAAAIVLLVACANVANLFLVRSEAKQPEVTLRRALGGGTGGIVAYFLAESALLSVLGGALGVLLAWFAVHLFVAFGPPNLPRLQEVQLDGFVITCAVAFVTVTTCAFGLIPLRHIGPIAASLNGACRGSAAGARRSLSRQVLIATQMALALVLLISAGLLVRSFDNLKSVDPGFDDASALTFRVGLPSGTYQDRERMAAAHLAILDRLSVVSGTARVAATTCLPLSEQGCFSAPLNVEGRVLPAGIRGPQIVFVAVTANYFETMRTRVLQGRGINQHDVDFDEPIVVVNEALANVAFPGQDPIGQRVRAGSPAASGDPSWLTVVGIVSNTSYRGLAETTPVPIMYMPMLGQRVARLVPPIAAMNYVVRTVIAPQDLTGAARRAVAEADPNLALAQVSTLATIVERSAARMGFTMVLLTMAAAVTVFLGVVGIYGVMSYSVTQRTGEIGVRLALGAEPRIILRMVVSQGVAVVTAGVAVGIVIALAGTRVMESLLYRVSPRDVSVFTTTSVLVLGVALVACWLPARRAARLSPLDALRVD